MIAKLELDAVSLRFGGVAALDAVSLQLASDEFLAIIGPNGAGKTALLNCMSGFYSPAAGRVMLDGVEVTGRSTHSIAARGLARTFQGTRTFASMTVLDNVLTGRTMHYRTGVWAMLLGLRRANAEEVEHRRRAEEIIEFLELQTVRDIPVGELGYGLRKRVDLGRALAMEPSVLLLDEPMAGMNHEERLDMARYLLDVRAARHIPMILVEHDMNVVLDITDRVVVLDFGRVIASGLPAEVVEDQAVIAAYLGAAVA